jgi:GNAT superfamily N-acetyltransferase
MRIKDLLEIRRLPLASINLMWEKTHQNDPFYKQIIQRYYDEAMSRHPKFPFVKKYQYGYALCKLPGRFEDYFGQLESAARGNYRKALRNGYVVKRFDFNSRLDDIREIWQSTPTRQGTLPAEIREGRVRPNTNPVSRTSFHDYPYFGVFKEEKLLAYAGCLVSGEICNLADFYGHDKYLNDGIVPLLIIEIARECYRSYPAVKIYSYGTYFGASDSMRRFKRKFLFYPHNTSWILGDSLIPQKPDQQRLIYRMDLAGPLASRVVPEGAFVVSARLQNIMANFPMWTRTWGWKGAIKTALKILSLKRILFGVIRDRRVVQFGWVHVGECRFYPVEQDAVVLETLWTDPLHRRQGFASATIYQTIVFLSKKGFRRFYIDTILSNVASQRMIEKAGFSECVAC